MLNKFLVHFPFLSPYLENQSPLRDKLTGGFAWAFLAKILVSGSGIILNIILVRILPPEEVGGYFLALSIISIFSAITLLGFKQTIVKLISESFATKQFGRANQAIRSVLWIAVLSSLIGGIFLAFGGGEWLGEALFKSPFIGEISGLLGVWLFFFAMQSLISEIFRGFQDFRLASLFGEQGAITRLLTISLLIIIWLLYSQISLKSVIFLAVLSNLVTLFISIFLLKHSLGKIEISSDTISEHDIFDLALPFWITSLGLIILTQADVVFLGILRPEQDVALYGVAMRLSLLASLPLMILNAVLPPIISELYAIGQKQRLEKMLRSTATLLLGLAIAVWLFFVFLGKPLLYWFFGAFYLQSYFPLLILSAGQVINVLSGSCGILMKMSGHHKQFMWITIIIGSGYLFIYPVLINLYGVIGASVSTMSFFSLVVLFSTFYSAKYIGIKTWPYWNLKHFFEVWKS